MTIMHKWKGADAFDGAARAAGYRVVRHPSTVMLPGQRSMSGCRRRRLRHRNRRFGAAAPALACAGPRIAPPAGWS